jgi:hypothetical protein
MNKERRLVLCKLEDALKEVEQLKKNNDELTNALKRNSGAHAHAAAAAEPVSILMSKDEREQPVEPSPVDRYYKVINDWKKERMAQMSAAVAVSHSVAMPPLKLQASSTVNHSAAVPATVAHSAYQAQAPPAATPSFSAPSGGASRSFGAMLQASNANGRCVLDHVE